MTETRLAFIHPFQLWSQRGIEVYLWNLAAALAAQGVSVDILTWAGPLNVPDFARIPGINLLRVPSVRYFQAQFAVVYYIYWLLRADYQHIFVHFAGYGEGFALRLVQLINPIRFSVVLHFPPSLVPQRYHEFSHWGFQNKAIHLIAVSKSTAGEVEKWSGRSCLVIEHGVDTQRFHHDPGLRSVVRRELGLGEDVPVLISVAALEERKGMQWVIRAMPEILQAIPDIHFLIVGDGPYYRNLAALVKELALEERVHFLGVKLDIQPFLCAADIMMALSSGDASSISLLEALACKLPAITSSHPPFDELVNDNCGLRVDEKNVNQVSSAIIHLAKDPARRNDLGNAGRDRVITRHAWPDIAEQYVALVNEN